MEDLWSFNEEIVARAIFDCRMPVVTGIGHEMDMTIADLVADRARPHAHRGGRAGRARTPRRCASGWRD